MVAVIANTIAWSKHIPVVESVDMPTDADAALQLVLKGTLGTPVTPQYYREPRIT